ncbi:hypothetical protein GQ53DRAFT_855803 [Thozetella sp. PMI_491]|nr:hypothetical protein GQ53DRAFT_855803 [Thozetella sp. PMI_491]
MHWSYRIVLLAAGLFGKPLALGHVQRNLHTIRTIYNLTTYPNNLGIHTGNPDAIPPGLFNSNATGRISPVGNFTGYTDSVEYFFALSPLPSEYNSNLAVYKADVVHYTSGCPEIAASVVYLYSGAVDPATGEFIGNQTTILTQVAFWRFDDQGAVVQYQAWIPNLQQWIELASGFPQTPDQSNAAIYGLCQAIQSECTGANQQYDSINSCVATLTTKTYGSYDEAWGDTVVCRNIHIILAALRPEAHCPHVGPIGGSPPNNWKCTNIDYRVDYFDDALLYGKSEDIFVCSRADN